MQVSNFQKNSVIDNFILKLENLFDFILKTVRVFIDTVLIASSSNPGECFLEKL